MDCYKFTINKKERKKLKETGIVTMPFYQRQFIPEEGDRIYFNNSEGVFTVDKVMPSECVAELIELHKIDELARPYLVGFFDLALRQLYQDFEIIGIDELLEEDRHVELGSVSGDACLLTSNFEVELALAEAENEGKSKVTDDYREEIISSTRDKTVRNFYSQTLPSAVASCYTWRDRPFVIKHNPVVAYLDAYVPIALMTYYREHDLEEGEVTESIPVAYVDVALARNYDLEVEDIQYIVEELFDYTLKQNFDPETATAVLENPMIIVPANQAVFYEGLIDRYGWRKDKSSICFGYVIYN